MQYINIVRASTRIIPHMATNLLITDANNLPLHTGTITGSTDYVIAVIDNTTVRVPIESFYAPTQLYYSNPPEDYNDTGSTTPTAISWDDTGVYTLYNGTWGKTPRISTNWDELTGTWRPVLTNTTQSLSDSEKATARSNIGVEYATADSEGLVILAGNVKTGANTSVPTTAAVRSYVMDTITEFVPASKDELMDMYTQIRAMYDAIAAIHGNLLPIYDGAVTAYEGAVTAYQGAHIASKRAEYYANGTTTN